MGNFYQVEIEFVRRTLNLVNQYEQLKELYDFEEQYNHTLLINCLLGLIILPKENLCPSFQNSGWNSFAHCNNGV